MKVRTLVVAMSLALCAYASLAGTVDFSAVGYVQYGDNSLPIANYQFGYGINDGPFAAVSALDEIKLPLSADPVVKEPRQAIGFNNIGKLYPTLPDGAGDKILRSNPGRPVSAAPLMTKDDSLLSLKSFLADKNTAVFHNEASNAAGSEYPSVTPSIAAWAKEWMTDTSDSITDDYIPEGIETFPSIIGGGISAEKEGLVTFDGMGGVSPVGSRATSTFPQPGIGSVMLAAYSGSSLAGVSSGSGSRLPSGGRSVSPEGGGNPGGSTPPSPSVPPVDKNPEGPVVKAPDLPPVPEDKKPVDPIVKAPDTYIPDPSEKPIPEEEPDDKPLPPPEKPDPSLPGGPDILPTGGGAGGGPVASNETPEPATLVLLGSALLGFSTLRRRVKK